MPSDRVLVVGGGIAGLSAAVALRAHDYPVDVVELTGHVEPESINFNGRAVDGLADLGILGECTTRANTRSGPVFGQIYDSSGRRRDVPRPPQPRNALPPAVVIYRPVLMEVLRKAAAEAGALIRQPCTVESIIQVTDSVLVSFDDETTAEYEVVVGADGVHSRVRELVWGREIQPSYTGALGLRWMAGKQPEGEPGFYYAPGHVVVVGRLPDDETYVATHANTSSIHVTQGEARELLRGVLDMFSAPYLRMLRDRIDEKQHIVTRPWESLWVQDWQRGRVVLIGDAAHATAPYMPAGAGMAVVDAVVLGEELAVSEDVNVGLASFVARRQERARMVVEASIEITRLQQSGAQLEATHVLRSASKLLALPY